MTTGTEISRTFIILIPGFPVDETDTTCLPAQQLLIREINRLDPSLEIIILAFQYPFHNKEYTWYGNRVIPFNGETKTRIVRSIIWLKILIRLRKLKKQKNIIGVFSCWCTECAVIGKYFTKRNFIPHFIWICGQDARANNKLVKLIRPAEDSLIAISAYVQDEFFKNHKIRPGHIIENGIDTTYFHNEQAVRHIDILGVGSLIPLKQFELFIQIVSDLKKIKPDIKAVICGKGPQRNSLQILIKDLQLENNITLAGEKPHGEILLYMHQSKILLHPSSYEGFSGVCIEALYAGAHVVSFCDPVKRPIKHWHIVADALEMYQKALDILNDANADYSPVLVNDMATSAKKLVQLYDIGL